MTTTHDPYRSERAEYTRWLADPTNAKIEERAHVQAALDRLPPAPGSAGAPASAPVAVDLIAESWGRAFAASPDNAVPSAGALPELVQPQLAASADDPHGWGRAFARAAADRS